VGGAMFARMVLWSRLLVGGMPFCFLPFLYIKNWFVGWFLESVREQDGFWGGVDMRRFSPVGVVRVGLLSTAVERLGAGRSRGTRMVSLRDIV
jgi:hypothetical protein